MVNGYERLKKLIANAGKRIMLQIPANSNIAGTTKYIFLLPIIKRVEKKNKSKNSIKSSVYCLGFKS